MVIPTPDSGILKRLYANLLGPGGAISLDIPDKVLKRLYTYGSPKNTDRGIEFEVKNRLQDAKFAGINRTRINGESVDASRIRLETADGDTSRLDEATEDDPIPFPVGRTVTVLVEDMELPTGDHEILVEFTAKPFGELTLDITDTIRDEGQLPSVPRSEEDNYSEEAIAERHEWLAEQTGVELEHVPEYSFDSPMGEGKRRELRRRRPDAARHRRPGEGRRRARRRLLPRPAGDDRGDARRLL